jgi:hypothetical protein
MLRFVFGESKVKTFPVDGVTLTAFFFAMALPQLPKCSEPVAADLQIVRARLSRLLLERVQNVDRLRARRHVNTRCAPRT